MIDVRWLLVSLLVACGGSSAPIAAPPPPTPRPAKVVRAPVTTTTRSAVTPLEQQLVEAGHVLDPALECVARAVAEGDTAFEHALPLRCGSPFYVLDAVTASTDDEVVAAIAALDTKRPSPLKLALGIVTTGPQRTVVMARRGVELEPIARSGSRVTLRGQALVLVPKGTVYVSTARGITETPFVFDEGRFEVAFDAPADALVEVTITDRTEASGPLFRLELGEGSPLFAGIGDAVTLINGARRTIGRSPVVAVSDGSGSCNPIAPQVAGIDVTDRAKCIDLFVEPTRVTDELRYRAELQSFVLDPRVAVYETSPMPSGTSVRLLQRFEALPPAEARTRVLSMLKARWPTLEVREVEGDALAAIVQAWSKETNAYDASATYKPMIDKLARTWSTRKTTYNAAIAARDFTTALAMLRPDVVPLAADTAVIDVRRPDGAMVHLIAVMLEQP